MNRHGTTRFRIAGRYAALLATAAVMSLAPCFSLSLPAAVAAAQGASAQPHSVSTASGDSARRAGRERRKSPEDLLREALDSYREAQSLSDTGRRLAAFARSERLFNAVVDSGAGTSALFANLGTAALQARHLGPAILAFRRALALDAGNQQAHRNLVHARGLLPAWVPKPEESQILDTFFFWHYSMSATQRSAAAAAIFLLLCLLAALGIRRRMPHARNAALLLSLLWVALLASLSVESRRSASDDAVVIVSEVVTRSADSPNSPPSFARALPGGTEVTVVETRENWVKVRLGNDREAWLPRGSIASIGADLRH